jgi:hypothetical protein
MTLNERLLNIKNTWQVIKAKDPQLLLMGATTHQYNLNTTLTNNSIQAFEQQHSIELPEEYKSYLLTVSNGGPCLNSSMYSLETNLQPLGKKADPNHYKLDFVVTEEKIVEYLTHRMQHAINDTPPITTDYKAGGYLFLCDKSENSYYVLALNGACKNEVYVLTKAKKQNPDGSSEPYFTLYPEVRFVNDQIKTLSFVEWIEDVQKDWFNTNADLDKQLTATKIMWHNYAAWDKDKAVFGAFMHNYQLNEVLSEDKILELEKKYQFIFPNEYREYLKIVSNGGVGPFYGMYSFENSTIALNSGSRDEGNFSVHLNQHPNHYSKLFPITDAQVDEYLLNKVKNPKGQTPPIKLSKDAGGYLFLAEYGCGGYYIMPVNGNGAGEVWYLQKMNANKLTYEMTDAEGNVTMSGSYGGDGDDSYFELYPELKWNNEQASTVSFLEWLTHKQSTWFAELSQEEPIAVENLNNENAYYPLAVGNTWTYKHYSGEKMVTTINSMDNDGTFLMSNSLNPINTGTKKINGEYFSDGLEKGNMQLILKDNLVLGDTWEAKFKANGIDCVYKYTVKEILPSKTVEGKEYKNVAMVELDSCYLINGNLMSMNAFTQTYYAKGVGGILTTTSGVIAVDPMPLMSHNLY